jgi:competence protein ComFC
LICHEIIYQDIGWRRIILPSKEPVICITCEKGLEKIEGEICRMCSRPFKVLAEQYRHGDLCHDCLRWDEDPEWNGCLDRNISVFVYNEFLKEVMAKFKFRGDYVLGKVFAEFIRKRLPDADFYVPIPLSSERLYERGFNQAKAMIIETGMQPSSILSRIHSEKQSKKNRLERIRRLQPRGMVGTGPAFAFSFMPNIM